MCFWWWTGKFAAVKATELGIGKDNRKLQFAQLYAMAETLSFGLKNAGFRVSKYLPFGPVEQIMPYLLRRAEENRGLLSTSNMDRLLMRYRCVKLAWVVLSLVNRCSIWHIFLQVTGKSWTGDWSPSSLRNKVTKSPGYGIELKTGFEGPKQQAMYTIIE